MAATKAAPAPATLNREAAPVTAGGFAPSVWGDFFITYVHPFSQRSEELMRQRREQLKGQVRRMFAEDGCKAIGVVDAVALVDTLERLGMDNHFREEIAAALSRIHAEEGQFAGSDLHVVATRFRLLRQHGLRVSADVFDKFRDSEGSFIASLSSDARGLLSLYNAAHMAAPGEAEAAALDGAIAFASRHLRTAMRSLSKLASPMAEQVSRALDIPLPRFTRWLETMHYVAEYEREEAHDGVLLELARLNFNLVRSLHLRELKALSMWWRDLYDSVKLPYARDRMVEIYFWTCGMFHEEEYSRARIIFAKTFGLTSLLDDTYDVHATLDECRKLNEALQRWDESAVSVLPEYLRVLYTKMLSNFKEFEDMLEPDEKYRMSYTKKAYKLLSHYYLQEATWSSENYRPGFKEHVEVSVISSGLPMLSVVALMGMGDEATKEAFDWAIGVSDAVNASGEIARFLNDIAAYKLGKNKKDVSSSVECYMKEHGATGEEAVAAIAARVESGWRTMNRACVDVSGGGGATVPVVQMVVNLTRTLEIIYLRGRDAYTFGGDLKDLVTALFLSPMPL